MQSLSALARTALRQPLKLRARDIPFVSWKRERRSAAERVQQN